MTFSFTICALFSHNLVFWSKKILFWVLKCRGTHFQWRRNWGRKLTCTAPFFFSAKSRAGPILFTPCQVRNSIMLPPQLPAARLVWDLGSKIICEVHASFGLYLASSLATARGLISEILEIRKER